MQKTRSRGKSIPLDLGVNDGAEDSRHNLCRSISETNLTADSQSTCIRSCREALKNVKDQSQGEEPEAEAYKATHCPANEREETESSDDNSKQYSIHPPLEFPYFLLLQGFSYRQVRQIPSISLPPSLPYSLLPYICHPTQASLFPEIC